ncbi:alanine--tRNA ligase [Rhodoluna sp. KAS3]|uniref:alanine--tRNA ligase n=1 Tax=Rhodoluna sp. KAS3 TaxID=942880 RepID=UPI00223049FC|nr:alanine--tRNA ligase [Rhodoluna sp. KAS3]BDS49051.1 alanine--tRNA ligase [Rhodoluna sp. KAS3]
MQTAEIRRRWLDFFENKGHTVVPSASLISEDPSLLFTVAGMVPFIPYMSGLVPAPYPRATSVQKCVRTLDIEEVGKTTRHGTFFQMNGNFSFGDYFKPEAIAFAWEFLTGSVESGCLGLDPQLLWVTVFQDDDESIQIWRDVAGIPMERIQRRGMKDNYWSTGQPGPAGPCSEIYYDRGPAYGREGGPEADEDRYIEIWNLVFMQYERGQGTGKDSFEILGELPKKNIDTGMGLERVAFLMQGVENLYEIDQVRPVLDLAAKLSGKTYGANTEDDVRLRVVADHVRSALMLIGDGVTPANDGRGYVLRRLLRRTVRAMRLLGVDQPTFGQLFPESKDAMKAAYPELEVEFERILRVAIAEEETFLRTLSAGTVFLDQALDEVKSSGSKQLAGDAAFLLHDTYGFPIDLTLEIAEEAGLTVDRDGFKALMAEQRDRAKADAREKKLGGTDLSVYSAFRALGVTKFTGYEQLATEGSVLGLIVDGADARIATQGQIAEVILDETSFYAESGGQDSDAGFIVGSGVKLEVLDVQKPVKGLISHKVLVREGQVEVGQKLQTEVDAEWRLGACQAHSGTHVVHAALRQVLGPTALQSGSYNKPGYLRLDFSWAQALSLETKSEIEEVTNLAIRGDLAVSAQLMELSEAREWGAVALFGETYDEQVRVVQIGGPWSRELCGGTHVSRSAQIGLVSLIGEASVGSGSRRLEALVGIEAFRSLASERALVARLTDALKTPKENLEEKLASAIDELKAAQRKIASLQAGQLAEQIPALIESAEQISGTSFISADLGQLGSVDDLRTLATKIRDKVNGSSSVIALFGEVSDKPMLVVATTESARTAGHKAGALVRAASAVLGGGGGGKDDLAQGGGADTSKISEALAAIRGALNA